MTAKEKRQQRQKVIEFLYSRNKEDFKLGYNMVEELKLKIAIHEWHKIARVSNEIIWSDFCQYIVSQGSPKKAAYWLRYGRIK